MQQGFLRYKMYIFVIISYTLLHFYLAERSPFMEHLIIEVRFLLHPGKCSGLFPVTTAFYFSYRSSTYICVFSVRKESFSAPEADWYCQHVSLLWILCADSFIPSRRSVSGLDFSWKQDKFLCTFLLRISALGRSGQLSSSLLFLWKL